MTKSDERPTLAEFAELMRRTDELLNAEAVGKADYYKDRNGVQLEKDVLDALVRCAVGTPFEGRIEHISGSSFPDIVLAEIYGVEVKSTNKAHWRSIGSSILESTRNRTVEHIFLTFGKLASPVEFRSRPYEECLCDISVTHYPRYQIDMELKPSETIFDKMGVPYDELRKLDNPVSPVSQYYKSQLKAGESLWWAADPEEAAAPPTVRLWNTLERGERDALTVKGYALFPEILGNSNVKYQRFALWLVTHCSVVVTNIRDLFSAGGKVSVKAADTVFCGMPAAFGRIAKYREMIAETILSTPAETLEEFWGAPLEEDRIGQWCRLAAQAGETEAFGRNFQVLTAVFSELGGKQG